MNQRLDLGRIVLCRPCWADFHLNHVRATMADKDYIDPKGYFVCPEGTIRRLSDEGGEQRVIVKKTDACSEGEWRRVCEALISVKRDLTPASRTLPQFHVEHNCVIIS